jgi:hypothetical protein
MSKGSLEQFIKQEICPQPPKRDDLAVQEKLKATDSLESFANLMVSLGNELNYSFTAQEVQDFIREEQERRKTAIQEKFDRDKAQMENLHSPAKEQMQASAQAEADKQKLEIDDAVQNHWQKSRIVEIVIANRNGDPIRPLY